MTEKPKRRRKSKSAAVFVSFVANGVLKHTAYSREEAEKAGLFGSNGYDLLGPSQGSARGVASPEEIGLRCPECGFTESNFRETGRFGCSRCYRTFGKVVRPLLQKLHARSSHLGKIPVQAMAETLINNRIKRLKGKMRKAVASERFEEAAGLRDEIGRVEEARPDNI